MDFYSFIICSQYDQSLLWFIVIYHSRLSRLMVKNYGEEEGIDISSDVFDHHLLFLSYQFSHRI